MPRHHIATVITLLSILVGNPSALAQTKITIVLNGRPLQFDGGHVIEQGRILVSVRGLLQEAGLSVHWEADKRLIKIFQPNGTTILTIGSTRARVNGRVITLDDQPQMRLGRVLLPVRSLSRLLGGQVVWNPTMKTATVTIPIHASVQQPPPTSVQPPRSVPKGGIESGIVAEIRLDVSNPEIVIRTPTTTRAFRVSAQTSFHRVELISGRIDSIGPRLIFPGDLVRLSVEVGALETGLARRVEVLVREERGIIQQFVPPSLTLEGGRSFPFSPAVRVLVSGQFVSAEAVRQGSFVILRINPVTGEVTEILVL